MNTTPRPLVPFTAWSDLLAYLTGDGRADREHRYVWYQAPLDSWPRMVEVVKVYKNGKVKLRTSWMTWTADEGHLDRFRRFDH